MKHFSLLFLFCLLTPVHAEIFKGVDAEGQTIYSDQNLPNTKKITPPTENLIKMPKLIMIQPNATKDTDDYSYLNIDKPTNDLVIRDNLGNLSVQLSIKPALNTEDKHYIALYLDDKIIFPNTDADEQDIILDAEPSDQEETTENEANDQESPPDTDTDNEEETIPDTTQIKIPLSNIDRGTHTIFAEVLDADEEVLITSNSVTFHMKRHSIQHKAPFGKAPGPQNSDGNPYSPGPQGVIFKPGPIITPTQ
ncbi:MAG: DUF4124 domain-containing protein [Gammaproteobacteria bacterium]|nr:DUF4124 domain-containing protein [Gammaproteobacteria bacterium]MCW8922594.1 DUF4124 domain-containing protein [Gammaproteobacteria bacterium]